MTWKPAIVVALARWVCLAAPSADGSSDRTSHGLARRAGSSMTRWKVASTESAATSVITMNVSAAIVSSRGRGS